MILTFERSQVVAMAEMGFLNKKAILHFDVCKAISEGKTAEQIAEIFEIDSRLVRWIKKRKCPNC